VDDKFGKLKFTIPKFTGDNDADASGGSKWWPYVKKTYKNQLQLGKKSSLKCTRASYRTITTAISSKASKANTRHQVRGRILQGNGNDYDAHQVGGETRTNNGMFL
jgi:hypothetical protein